MPTKLANLMRATYWPMLLVVLTANTILFTTPQIAEGQTIRCGSAWSADEEVRYAHLTLTISPSSMTAIFRQDPDSWGSRRAAFCEFALIIAQRAANGAGNTPQFTAMSAHFYVGRYSCRFGESGETLYYEGVGYSAEYASCTHMGRYPNKVTFLETALTGAANNCTPSTCTKGSG
jgi:hypothetical protein